MTDHCAHRAVVHGVIPVRIVERRLQDAGRENNFVQLRIVVRVHRRRRHPPFATIHRLADLAPVARGGPLIGRAHVLQILTGRHAERRVILPLVGESDLLGERSELRQCLRFCRRAHPVQLLDPVVQLVHEVHHDLERARLCFRREVGFHVFLPEHLAEALIRRIEAALPARQHLGRAAEDFVERKVLLDDRRAERRRGDVHEAPAQKDFPVGDRNRGEHLVHRREKLRLSDVDRRDRRRVLRGEERGPSEPRRELCRARPWSFCGSSPADREARPAFSTRGAIFVSTSRTVFASAAATSLPSPRSSNMRATCSTKLSRVFFDSASVFV